MTELLEAGTVPEWTLGWRLQRARVHAGLSQQQLADEIGISRRSLSAYETDEQKPRKPVLLSWSLRCQVPLAWLRDGFRTAPTPIPATSKGDVRQLGARDAREQSRRALRNFPTTVAI